MLRTKKDVDAHVRDIFSKLQTDKEKSLRCFSIARSYSGIQEFETAARYLEMYIRQHPHPDKLGDAYKLMADILHDMKDEEGALEYYKKSYFLTKSRVALNRVCDLLQFGHGKADTNESRKKWFELQKVAATASPSPFQCTPKSEPDAGRNLPGSEGLPTHSPLSARQTPANRMETKPRILLNGSNGNGHSSLNNNPGPEFTLASSPKQNNRTLAHSSPGTDRMEIHVKYLERKFDNVLSQLLEQNNKLMDQNTQLLNSVTLMGDEIKDLRHTVSSLQSPAGSPFPTHDSRIIDTPPNGKDTESLSLPSTHPIFRQEPTWTQPSVKPAFQPSPAPAVTFSTPSLVSGSGLTSNPTPTLAVAAAAKSSPFVDQKSATGGGEKPALSPGSFSFKPSVLNSTQVPSQTETLMQAVIENKTPSTTDPTPTSLFSFSNTAAAKLPGFGDLATQNKDSEFSFGGATPSTSLSFGSVFGSTPSPLFGIPALSKTTEAVPQKEDRLDGEGHGESAEDFVPTAEFTPVVPLPPLVEVKKGDEDENLIFEARAKLFRFVENEWKERGVGNIKLLQDKRHKGKVRVVMWREQIHKLACNHKLLPDSTIDFMQNKKNVLMWGAMDFADGEPKKEMFSCRFGKEEVCSEFKNYFEKLVDEVISAGPGEERPVASKPESAEVPVKSQVPLSELFKKAEGSWTCSGCYMDNAKEALKCPSCATPQPGVASTETVTPAPVNSSGAPLKFGFGTSTPQKSGSDENFSNAFSFRAYAPAAVQPAEGKSNSTVAPAPASVFSFSNTAAAKLPGFGDLASQNKDSEFSFGGTKPSTSLSFGSSFGSTPSPLFGIAATPKTNDTVSPKEGRLDGEGHEESAEEFVPTAEFTPVIPLPPLVEVKKGDEDENLIFEARAKLYRFVVDTKEWKERGIGNIKLLQDKRHKGKVRVVMWREQIHKLACNHNLLPDSTIDFMQNKQNVLIWGALDFADGEPKKEMFCCRFGKEEVCAEFKNHFEKLVEEVISAGPGEESPKASAPGSAEVPVKAQVPLSELFKKPAGSWTCTGCYMDNAKEALKCPSCATAQPGVVATETVAPTESSAVAPLKFGFGTITPLKSNSDEKSSNAFASFSFGKPNSSVDPAPTNVFSFSNTAAAKLPGFGDLASQNKDSEFSFGGATPSTSLSFSSVFGSTPSPLFGGASAPNTYDAAGPKESHVDGDGHDESAEEFVPTAEFTPVIPLPPLVDVKKGDEDENLIYEARAKLYRFVVDTREWKERGIGNIKLLQDKRHKGKVRVVMWRDQIHKLACNHNLIPDSNIDFMQNKRDVLIWGALDFADGEPKKQMFCCRFGKEDVCSEFKDHFEKLNADVISAGPGEESPKPSAPGSAKASLKAQVPLSELCKKPEGSWTCGGCYMDNAKEALKCPSCATAQPGVTPSETVSPTANSAVAPLKFGFGTPTPQKSSADEKSNNAFASFSFGKPNSTVEPSPASVFSFSNTAAAKLPGFGDLASQNKDSEFSFGGSTASTSLSFSSVFGSTPSPVFGGLATPKTSDAASEGHDESAEEFVPTAEFTPVIPLPPLVEVKKGDEDENLIFEARAKLYRFVAETKEWKERGVGNIKLLQDKRHKGKVRVVMWREQIHKLACNHNLLPDSTIDFMQNKLNVLIWGAMDFADGEPKKEMFTCRFGKEEVCAEFKNHFEKLVAEVISAGPGEESPKTSAPGSTEVPVKSQVPLSELFQKVEGSWTCSGCYMDNAKEALKCPSCATAQPGVASTEAVNPPVFPAMTPLKFGFGNVTPQKPGSDEKSTSVFPSFSFGSPVPATVPLSEGKSNSSVDPAPANLFSFSKPNPNTLANFSFLAPVPAPVAQTAEGEHASGSCPGCIGCDPDSFDFSRLDSRQVPSYPEQSLTPVEYANQARKQLTSQPEPVTPVTQTVTQPTPAPTSLSNFAMSSSPLSFNFVSSLANFQHQSQSPSSASPQPNLNTSASSAAQEDDEDDEDYEDDEDEAPMFEGPATVSVRYPGNPEYEDMGEGMVSVTYDNELYCSRFHFLGDVERDLDHVIASDTHLQPIGDLSFAWTGLSESDHGTYIRLELQATFATPELYANFLDRFSDGQEIAGQAGVTEEYLVSEDYEDEQ